MNSKPTQDSKQQINVNWQAKYAKEHDRKKKLNKKNKKNIKKLKRLTKANQALKDQLNQLETNSFIHEHDYF